MVDLPSVPGAAPAPLIDSIATRKALGGIGRRTLYVLRRDHGLPFVRVGAKKIMFSPEAIQQWISDRTEGGRAS